MVIVSPMTSISGYINYLSYTAGSNKGNATNGIDENGDKTGEATVFNDPFKLGDAHEDYTSSKVTKNGKFATAVSGSITLPLKWSPVVKGSVLIKIGDNFVFDKFDASSNTWKLFYSTTAPEREERIDRNGNVVVDPGYPGDEVALTGTILYGTTRDDRFNAGNIPAGITFPAADITTLSITGGTTEFELAYVYNNVYIPQNDIPLLNVETKSIALTAKARRIAVYFSQIAAFQAKTDYGFDLQDQLVQQATGRLSYEIDTETVQLLAKTAFNQGVAVTWDRTLPIGVSKQEHYAGFAEIVGIANQVIYDRTKRFAANWMLIASDILPILMFVPGFTAAPAGSVNGPYFAGTLNAIKVFVSPALRTGQFVVGVKGDDMQSAVAVYAPYMPIVPTQLLQYADGGTSQGFSTLYDLKVLNPLLAVAGTITGTSAAFGQTGTGLAVEQL